MDKETIKCGRNTFDLVDGDAIMDNGACYQLMTRLAGRGYATTYPIVSKKEFRKFIGNEKVVKKVIGPITMYTYTIKK